MRAAAALLAGLAVAVSGCGGSGSNVSARGADAARLVPPDALAFVNVDARDSEGWKTVSELTGQVLFATGDTNYAYLDVGDGKPALIAVVRSDDQAALRDFPNLLSDANKRRYMVEQIGGWHVLADSPKAFAAVRAAQAGRSLADVDGFQRAMREVVGDSLATAYADGARLADVPGELGALFRVSGASSWVGARVFAEDNAARVSVRADITAPVYRPRLLREVPSGALLAISFEDAHELLQRIAAEPSLRRTLGEYRSLLVDLAPAMRGEGIFYVSPGVLLPKLVLEIEGPDPAVAAQALRRLARATKAETDGVLSLSVLIQGSRVILTNGQGPSPAGARLVDDQPFKDALAAADAPEEVTWLAYADLQRLVPIVQTLAQLLGAEAPSGAETARLERLGTLVAYGAADRLELRIAGRE
jgi:hypothetical protein